MPLGGVRWAFMVRGASTWARGVGLAARPSRVRALGRREASAHDVGPACLAWRRALLDLPIVGASPSGSAGIFCFSADSSVASALLPLASGSGIVSRRATLDANCLLLRIRQPHSGFGVRRPWRASMVLCVESVFEWDESVDLRRRL